MKYFFLSAILFFSVFANAQNNSTIKEYYKTYPTYPFSNPNPVPDPSSLFYPYFRYDGFAAQAEKKDWKVVELENDFIKVQIMPEIGGKIWTAIDKKDNKPFIYDNDAVKFRDIAMRGPWTSGGLEANFGIIGHTPGVATPVNYLTYTQDDGSAVCLISLLDLLTSTRWNMQVILPKDKAYFITRFLWHNGTSVQQPYYSWMNLGQKVTDSLEYIFPGNHHLFHDGKVYDWPIDENNGKNISVYDQNDFGSYKSYHVTGTYSKYFGVFWQKENYGMIHFAEREAKIGKKVWIWGLSRQGMIWENLLTDNAGQYTEIQSGRLYNQNAPESVETPFKQFDFLPYNTDTWDEYWYPFKNTGGVQNADLNGVLNITNNNGRAEIHFSSVSFIHDTLMILGKDNKVLQRFPISLKPLESVNQQLSFSVDEITGVDIAGKKISLNNDDKKNLDRPVEPYPGFDWNTAYGFYLKGTYQSGTRHYAQAKNDIRTSLALNASYVPSLSEMAFIQYRQMKYDSAFHFAKTALSVDTYDPKANYYYGLSALKLGKVFDAKDGFQVAAITEPYRSAAYSELAKIAFTEGNFSEAKEYANKSLVNNSKNISSLQLLFLGYQKTGNMPSMSEVKGEILRLDPINHFIRFEDYLMARDDKSKRNFTELIKDELPAETYLNLAVWFAGLGLWQKCEMVLETCPDKNDEINYWLAWLNRDSGNYEKFLSSVNEGNPSLDFPFRSESLQVMQWAKTKTDTWKPGYYLALITAFYGDKKGALELLSGGNEPKDFAPYYVFRSSLRDSTDVTAIQNDLSKALSIGKSDWRYARNLSDFYLLQNNPAEAIKVIAPYYKNDNSNYMAGSLYLRCLIDLEDYPAAEKVLKSIYILPYEGAKDAHTFYRKTKLMLALDALKKKKYSLALQKVSEASLWPENLGVGAPYPEDIDSTLEMCLVNMIQKAKINKGVNMAELDEAFQKIKAL